MRDTLATDTFSFHAPADVFRRRLDPRWVRLGAVAVLVSVALVSFGRWVVASERAADRRREAAIEAQRASAEAPASVAPLPGDGTARAAATTALTIAQDVLARTGSFTDASTGTLSAEATGLVFVDGPSTGPAIVSVHAGARVWAAAVAAGPGRCVWVKATADGVVRYGAGYGCTGVEATAASLVAW